MASRYSHLLRPQQPKPTSTQHSWTPKPSTGRWQATSVKRPCVEWSENDSIFGLSIWWTTCSQVAARIEAFRWRTGHFWPGRCYMSTTFQKLQTQWSHQRNVDTISAVNSLGVGFFVWTNPFIQNWIASVNIASFVQTHTQYIYIYILVYCIHFTVSFFSRDWKPEWPRVPDS